MIQPVKYKNREPLNSLTGIKSSLGKLRSVISLTYLLYLANNKKESIAYSVQKGDLIVLKTEYLQFIKNYLKDNQIENVLKDNPILKSQIESLYVGLTLMFGLGKVSFEDAMLPITKERTGGIRYPKTIDFASNMITLDILLGNIEETKKIDFLKSWLKDEHCNNQIELDVSILLNLWIEKNLFKLRKGSTGLYFQTEGIYLGLDRDKTVTLESDETVGPARILNSMLNEGLVPWLSCSKSTISYNGSCSFDADAYSKMISTSLDIRSIKIEDDKNISTSSNLKFSTWALQNPKESKTLNSYLTAIRTKPFLLLAGISGTGKSRIVRKLAQATITEELHKVYHPEYSGDFSKDRWKLHYPDNFELVQVKPNWHNSMDVVGFKSNIGEPHYEFTPFVDFIAKAWAHTDVPFFLCLDEMNLAPVEEYFAEFLSAIESRSKNEKDGAYETDPIIKPFDNAFGTEISGKMMGHLDNFAKTTDDKLDCQFRNKGLTLPPNLIVMGTVNMDETTFSFSRKVLDRAMSIEMNEVDYDAFIEGKTEIDMSELTDFNKRLVDRPIKSLEVVDNIDAQKVINYLKEVNKILEGTPFKLGYRAANEALLYVSAANDFGNNDILAALDEFTLMKILSRIEGDDTKLKTTVNDKEIGDNLLVHLKRLFEKEFGTTSNKTLDKLNQMITILERDHFVSFWG